MRRSSCSFSRTSNVYRARTLEKINNFPPDPVLVAYSGRYCAYVSSIQNPFVFEENYLMELFSISTMNYTSIKPLTLSLSLLPSYSLFYFLRARVLKLFLHKLPDYNTSSFRDTWMFLSNYPHVLYTGSINLLYKNLFKVIVYS